MGGKWGGWGAGGGWGERSGGGGGRGVIDESFKPEESFLIPYCPAAAAFPADILSQNFHIFHGLLPALLNEAAPDIAPLP